jgi:superfamily II DNA or RNA helicase
MQASLDAFRKRRVRDDDGEEVSVASYGAGVSVPLASLPSRRLMLLQEEFTKRPRAPQFGGAAAPEPVLAYRVNEAALLLPRCAGLQRFPAAVDATQVGEPLAEGLELRGALQAHQVVPAREALRALRAPPYSGMLVLPCGFGKTFIALHLVVALGRKAVVVVHKEFLVQQWLDRIAAFLPGTRVGILQGRREEVQDRDIVVAMLQSLAQRDYAADTFDAFGTCILDEAHHLAARLFSEVFFRIPARHVLGLTATPVRKDGLTELLHAYMGPFAYHQRADGCDRPVRVLRVLLRSPAPKLGDLEPWQVQRLKTQLARVPARNEILLRVLLSCAAGGRRVLLLSDRLAHLHLLRDRLRAAAASCALYVGGMRAEARAEAERAGIILATFHMAAEGLDIPLLDALVLAAPAHDVVQAVGRVLRPCAEKQDPLVFDLVDDDCQVFVRAAEARASHYRTQRFQVEDGILPEQLAGRLESLLRRSAAEDAAGAATGGGPAVEDAPACEVSQ